MGRCGDSLQPAGLLEGLSGQALQMVFPSLFLQRMPKSYKGKTCSAAAPVSADKGLKSQALSRFVLIFRVSNPVLCLFGSSPSIS